MSENPFEEALTRAVKHGETIAKEKCLLLDKIREWAERVEQACPCRVSYKCGGEDDHKCTDGWSAPCACEGDVVTPVACRSTNCTVAAEMRKEAGDDSK